MFCIAENKMVNAINGSMTVVPSTKMSLAAKARLMLVSTPKKQTV
jgi:hypothetical protein